MEWYVYALIAAILTSVVAILDKRLLFRKHAMEFAAVIAIMNAIVGVAAAIFFGKSFVFPPSAFLWMVLIGALGAIAFLYTAKAVRHMPVSVSSPLFALGPILTAVVAFVFLGERLTPIDSLGIFLVVIGVYVIEHTASISVLENFKQMSKEKYFHYILFALFLFAITSTIDRYVLSILQIEPLVYVAIVQVLIAIIFAAMVWFFHDLQDISDGLRQFWPVLLLIAIISVTYRYSQAFALSLADGKAALVIAIKRSSALLTTVVGGSLFHEKNLIRNLCAALIIVAGVVLVII